MTDTDTREPRRITIIGCGYVGRALGAALAGAGHEVTGTTTTPARVAELQSANVTPRILTIDDEAAVDRAIKGAHAAVVTIAAGRGGDYEATYAQGLRRIVAACGRFGVRTLIYTSSTRVYAQDDGAWVDESTPVEPVDAQSNALIRAEQAVLDGHADVTGTVVRLGGIYGPGRSIAERVRAATGTRRDDGRHFVNLIHRDDIVAALERLVDHETGGVFNLVDDRPTPRRDLYDAIVSHGGLAPIVWEDRAGPIRGKRVSNARIKSELGLVLLHPTLDPA